jgi:hypothetical protein
MNKNSVISKDELIGCFIQVSNTCTEFVGANKIFTKLGKICKKYNKKFQGLFEIRLSMDVNGRYKLNIQENMSELPLEYIQVLENG